MDEERVDWSSMHTSGTSRHTYQNEKYGEVESDDESSESIPLKEIENGKHKKKKKKGHHEDHDEDHGGHGDIDDMPLTWKSCLRGTLSREGFKIIFILGLFFFTLFLFISDPSSSFAEIPQKKLYGLQSDQPLYRPTDQSLPMGALELLGSVQYVKNQTVAGDLYLEFLVETKNDGDTTWKQTESSKKIDIPKDIDSYFHDYIFLENGEPDADEVRLKVTTNSKKAIAVYLEVQQLYSIVRYQVPIGIVTLLVVYVLIIFEVIHRTIVAMVGSFWALAVISLVQHRPAFLEVIGWIDYDTLGLLFGMMILVGIFSETGFFEFCAVKAYRLSGGKVWNLVYLLCGFTAVMSGFFGSVPTILLLTPVTIRLCKVIGIDPVPIVLSEVVMSNIGGGATAIGDPPNVIIVNDPKIVASKQITFSNFILHVAPGVIVAVFVTLALLRWMLRNRIGQQQTESKRPKEIDIWRKTAEKIREYEGEEEKRVKQQLMDYINSLELRAAQDMVGDQRSPIHSTSSPPGSPSLTDSASLLPMPAAVGSSSSSSSSSGGGIPDISDLERRYRITNMPLFVKTVTVLLCVVFLFFIQSFVSINLSLPWIAILGAFVLLVASGIHDLERVLEKIELDTLLFFAGLFVLIHGIEKLGVMEYIATRTTDLVSNVPEGKSRLALAVVLIIWVGAIVGAFVDTIPFTKAMLPIVNKLGSSPELGLPLTPLVWALSYGCCLGGNGTLIAASANIVAAGLSEQQGYRITFVGYFKVGFPAMLLSVSVVTVYMLIFHVLIPWY